MNRKKLKIGCIGLGPRGAGLYKICLDNPDFEPYAVCDKNSETLEDFRHFLEVERKIDTVRYYTSIEEFLRSDVEAVIVATHVSTHCDISIQCMEAGKHVLCEIPNISSFEEAKKLKDAVDAHPELKFMVAENACFSAYVHSWKKMYEEGLLGDIVYAEADYIHPHMELQKYDENGQPILSWRSYMPSVHYLTHDLGPLLYIMEDTCEDITGFIPKINPIEDVHPAPADGLIIVHTTKGALIKVFIGFGVHHTMRHNLAVYGSKGSLEYRHRREEQGTLAYLQSIPYAKSEVVIPLDRAFPGASQAGHGGMDTKMLQEFGNCVLKNMKVPLDIEFGINIAIPGLLAEQSFKEGGKTLKMPDELLFK